MFATATADQQAVNWQFDRWMKGGLDAGRAKATTQVTALNLDTASHLSHSPVPCNYHDQARATASQTAHGCSMLTSMQGNTTEALHLV
jgi:hypothetical protein